MSPVALVTGSGKHRVGWHVADALAKRGYALVLHFHTSAVEAVESADFFRRQHGVRVEVVQADMADEISVRLLVAHTLSMQGRIDVLVNCAAVWQRKPLEEVTAADVRHHFEVNALGTFLCCQHAGLAMVRQPEGGCIVNMGDWAEARPDLHYAAYFPSKGAVTALTRSLAVELGSRNPRVRVNCVLPGPVMLQPDHVRGRETPGRQRHAGQARGQPGERCPGGPRVRRERFHHRRVPARRWRADDLCTGVIRGSSTGAVTWLPLLAASRPSGRTPRRGCP